MVGRLAHHGHRRSRQFRCLCLCTSCPRHSPRCSQHPGQCHPGAPLAERTTQHIWISRMRAVRHWLTGHSSTRPRGAPLRIRLANLGPSHAASLLAVCPHSSGDHPVPYIQGTPRGSNEQYISVYSHLLNSRLSQCRFVQSAGHRFEIDIL